MMHVESVCPLVNQTYIVIVANDETYALAA